MRDSARVFVGVPLATGGTRWELLATNNDVLDVGNTPALEGELPTFLSQSVTEFPDNPRQQVQPLFDDAGLSQGWRQARVDLSRYAAGGEVGGAAGLANLKFRFDFSTAGTVNRDRV